MSAGRSLATVIVVVLASTVAGMLYAMMTRAPSWVGGSIYGACIGLCISSFERGLVLRGLHDRVRRWPTPLFVPAMEGMTVLLALAGFAIAGLICHPLGLTRGSLLRAMVPSTTDLIYALVIAATLVTLTRVRDLLGHEVFVSLLVGRYHKPVEERRIFLFLDLVGSSAFARRHGDLRAQAYLGAIFAAVSEPVLRHKGSIDDYIGDMVMVSWPEQRGLAEARCVRCVLAIRDVIEARRDEWLARFGQVPRFHAALHGGSVVVAEVGVDRHKISYFGDVVNTTARIEALCRQVGASFLVSADLMGRLPALPPGLQACACGDFAVKGHDAMLSVFSLEQGETTSVYPLAGLTKGKAPPQNQRLGAESAP